MVSNARRALHPAAELARHRGLVVIISVVFDVPVALVEARGVFVDLLHLHCRPEAEGVIEHLDADDCTGERRIVGAGDLHLQVPTTGSRPRLGVEQQTRDVRGRDAVRADELVEELARRTEDRPAVVRRQQERDVARVLPTIRHLTERQYQLFFLFHTAIARHRPDGFARVIDGDVADAGVIQEGRLMKTAGWPRWSDSRLHLRH